MLYSHVHDLGRAYLLYFFPYFFQAMDKPWEKPNIGDVVKFALEACPDQLRPYLGTMENLWTPRDTENWYKVPLVVF